MLEVIRHEAPEVGVTADQLRPYLQSGFPWHTPERSHLEIRSAEQWWNALAPIFERAFEGVGIDSSRARDMGKQVRRVYPDPERWRLFDDTVPTLERLSAQDWMHVVLSNHVPELREIIGHLGLERYIVRVFNSAETGYEKPHPRAFGSVLQSVGNTAEVWMIGDNFIADVVGAECVGIPGVLVRKQHEGARCCCPDLMQVPDIIGRKGEWKRSGSDGGPASR